MGALADCMKEIKNKGGGTKQQTKDLLQMMKDTEQLATQRPTIMEKIASTTNTQPVPRVQAVPRVLAPVIEEERRITRSISKLLGSSDTTNKNTQPLPRVKKHATASSKSINTRLRRERSQRNRTQVVSGPAARTRSKTTPPAAAAKERRRTPRIQQPTKIKQSATGMAHAVHSINGKATDRNYESSINVWPDSRMRFNKHWQLWIKKRAR